MDSVLFTFLRQVIDSVLPAMELLEIHLGFEIFEEEMFSSDNKEANLKTRKFMDKDKEEEFRSKKSFVYFIKIMFNYLIALN